MLLKIFFFYVISSGVCVGQVQRQHRPCTGRTESHMGPLEKNSNKEVKSFTHGLREVSDKVRTSSIPHLGTSLWPQIVREQPAGGSSGWGLGGGGILNSRKAQGKVEERHHLVKNDWRPRGLFSFQFIYLF